MACDFTSFSTVYQSYKDDEGSNERLCAMEPNLRLERSPIEAGLEPQTARSADQRLTH